MTTLLNKPVTEILTAEAQRGRAATKTIGISRAKTQRAPTKRRFRTLRSWRLGAIKRIGVFGLENLRELRKLSTTEDAERKFQKQKLCELCLFVVKFFSPSSVAA
jgi:hypothetical protein